MELFDGLLPLPCLAITMARVWRCPSRSRNLLVLPRSLQLGPGKPPSSHDPQKALAALNRRPQLKNTPHQFIQTIKQSTIHPFTHQTAGPLGHELACSAHDS